MNLSFVTPSDAQASAATAAYHKYMDESTAMYRKYMDECTAAYRKYMAESAEAFRKYMTRPTTALSPAQRAAAAAAESAAAYRKHTTRPTALSPAQRAAAAAAESAAAYRKHTTRPTTAPHSGDQNLPRDTRVPARVSNVRPWSPAVVTTPRVGKVSEYTAKPAPALADPAYGSSDPQYGAAITGAAVIQESGARHARKPKSISSGLRDFLSRLLGG